MHDEDPEDVRLGDVVTWPVVMAPVSDDVALAVAPVRPACEVTMISPEWARGMVFGQTEGLTAFLSGPERPAGDVFTNQMGLIADWFNFTIRTYVTGRVSSLFLVRRVAPTVSEVDRLPAHFYELRESPEPLGALIGLDLIEVPCRCGDVEQLEGQAAYAYASGHLQQVSVMQVDQRTGGMAHSEWVCPRTLALWTYAEPVSPDGGTDSLRRLSPAGS